MLSKLTSTITKSLTLPQGQRDEDHFEFRSAHFRGARVRAGGSRNWVIQYKVGGKNRRLVLGAVSALDASKARGMAKDALAAVRLGKDPVADRFDAHVRGRRDLWRLSLPLHRQPAPPLKPQLPGD